MDNQVIFKVGSEGLAIGGILLIIFAIIHIMLMTFAPIYAMDHLGIFGAVFTAGFLTHITFEVLGLNDKYCKK